MQINGDRDWESFYQEGDLMWDHGEASPGLVDFLASNEANLPLGQALVPGCGRGHDARTLSKAGWRVTGLDIAPSSVPLAQELAAAEGLEIDFRLGNFLEDKSPQPFDLLFEHTLFCAINPGQRDAYVRAAKRWLRPGGTYLAVNYIITDDDGDPPFSTTAGELDERFLPDFELIRRWTPRSYENRQGKELMNLWRRR